jgi:predicted nucleic acid-binding protein
MTGLVFVDANVLLYARDQDAPAKRLRARAWLEMLWRHRLGRTSTQVLSEYYVNAVRKYRIGADEAWDHVNRYFAWDPRPVDATVMIEARDVQRRHRLSWWDSLVVAAAQLQGCVLLLTEDMQDGASFGTLAVRSPFTLDVEQPRARYDVEPLAAFA